MPSGRVRQFDADEALRVALAIGKASFRSTGFGQFLPSIVQVAEGQSRSGSE
jgi:hypothetical protein